MVMGRREALEEEEYHLESESNGSSYNDIHSTVADFFNGEFDDLLVPDEPVDEGNDQYDIEEGVVPEDEYAVDQELYPTFRGSTDGK